MDKPVRIVRSNDCGSFVLHSVPDPYNVTDRPVYIAIGTLYDDGGEKIKGIVSDNGALLLRIGEQWLRELAVADALRRNDTTGLLILQAPSVDPVSLVN